MDDAPDLLVQSDRTGFLPVGVGGILKRSTIPNKVDLIDDQDLGALEDRRISELPLLVTIARDREARQLTESCEAWRSATPHGLDHKRRSFGLDSQV